MFYNVISIDPPTIFLYLNSNQQFFQYKNCEIVLPCYFIFKFISHNKSYLGIIEIQKEKHRYLQNVFSDERDGHVEFIYLCNCLLLSCWTLCFFLVWIFTFFVSLRFKFKIFNHKRTEWSKILNLNQKQTKK